MLYGGRGYVLRGFSRQSHSGASQHVHLEDRETGAWITVPWADLWGDPEETETPPLH